MSKLKLVTLTEISSTEKKRVKGGVPVCGCGCKYENKGGSNTLNNAAANSGVHVTKRLEEIEP